MEADYAKNANDVFAGLQIDDVDLIKGKAVMTEGLPLPEMCIRDRPNERAQFSFELFYK